MKEIPLTKYSSIIYDVVLHKTSIRNKFMIFFGTLNIRDTFAIKINANKKSINSISLIKSKIKNKGLRPTAKWNFKVSTLKTIKNLNLEYGKKYNYKITTKDQTIKLFIDDNEILSHEVKGNINSGRFGFSNRNGIIEIDNVIVKDGEKVVFQDNFDTLSIKRYGVKFNKIKKKK